jgi:hypothetical protein
VKTEHIAALTELRTYLQEQRDFNEGWIALHERDGHYTAAERRRWWVTRHESWLLAIDAALVPFSPGTEQGGVKP